MNLSVWRDPVTGRHAMKILAAMHYGHLVVRNCLAQKAHSPVAQKERLWD